MFLLGEAQPLNALVNPLPHQKVEMIYGWVQDIQDIMDSKNDSM
jgi:hypothetical protein